jgi:hypothetical protein
VIAAVAIAALTLRVRTALGLLAQKEMPASYGEAEGLS